MTDHRRHPWLAFLATVFAVSLAPASPAAQDAERYFPSYKVIVHPHNRIDWIEKEELARLFLKKTTRWQGGAVVRPVDLHARSRSRRAFTKAVLGRSVSAVRSYWQQAIFSGRDIPPPELTSDTAVVRYVLRSRGAIGYVSGSARIGPAKVVEVR